VRPLRLVLNYIMEFRYATVFLFMSVFNDIAAPKAAPRRSASKSIETIRTFMISMFDYDARIGTFVEPYSLRSRRRYWFLTRDDGKLIVPR